MCPIRMSIVYLIILMFCTTNSEDKIKITIKVASSKGGLKVNFTGADKKKISDKDVKTFNITDDNLKNGTKVELGEKPKDVFLKDPTAYGNLYRKFKWQEVRRIIKVKSVVIQDIINENVLLTVHGHINNTTRKLKIPIKLLENVENSLKSSWSKNGFPDEEIYYETRVDFFNLYHNVFENKWRSESLKLATLPFGLQSAGHINVKPGRTVTMKLRAKRTLLLLRITYTAYLTGSIIVNYPHLLGKYHFYAPSVSNIMKAANISNNIITTEVMELKCHTDPVLDVFDKTSGEKVPIVFAGRTLRKNTPKQVPSVVKSPKVKKT